MAALTADGDAPITLKKCVGVRAGLFACFKEKLAPLAAAIQGPPLANFASSCFQSVAALFDMSPMHQSAFEQDLLTWVLTLDKALGPAGTACCRCAFMH